MQEVNIHFDAVFLPVEEIVIFMIAINQMKLYHCRLGNDIDEIILIVSAGYKIIDK